MEIVKRKSGLRYKEKVNLPNGETVTKTFRRKTDALQWKQSAEARKRIEPEFFSKHDDKITFSETFENWMNTKIRFKRGKKTILQYDKFNSKHFEPHFGKLRIAYITSNNIDRFVSYLINSGLKPKSVNNVLTLLKQVFKYAFQEEIIRSNPSRKVEFVKEHQKEVKYFAEEEINSLLRTNRFDEIYPILVMALNTGMRIGEIFGLCWDCINFERNQILVKRTATRYELQDHSKTSKIRYVPMNESVKNLLLGLMKEQKSLVLIFTNSKGQMLNPDHYSGRKFLKAVQRANVRKYNFHSLRHTYASQFMMKGGNIYDLQKILGHRSLASTMIYAHLSPQHLAEASNIVNYSFETANKESGPQIAPESNVINLSS